jgi:hypothetical protein
VQLWFIIQDYSVNLYIEEWPIKDCTMVKSCFYFSLLSR